MHQDRCVELVREAAVACGERHDYMPPRICSPRRGSCTAGSSTRCCWQPTRLSARRDEYRAGNTELLRLLMMATPGSTSRSCRGVREILVGAGLCERGQHAELGRPGRAQAEADHREQAVNECVTDPQGAPSCWR